MIRFFKFILFLNNFLLIFGGNVFPYDGNGMTPRTFMFWPNATVPFYINPDHFDHEQMLIIMTALSTFSFKTCLKFAPVMSAPEDSQHVMVFENPDGHRMCKIITRGHTMNQPHPVVLGYECLQSPKIDMIIMKALGFPFEHNRANRDVFIEVLIDNIEPGSMELFTKDSVLPPEMRLLRYDVNSVMHFGEREFSKNGHRTIIFKDRNTKQNRIGLSPMDIRKIDMVYGPECQIRDRQEKFELCQSYPAVARRKREVTTELKSLRVNPDITPPPETKNDTITDDLNPAASDNITVLGMDEEIQIIVEHAYKISAIALKNARGTYCGANATNATENNTTQKNNVTDLLKVIEVIADYAKSVVDSAVSNLTSFCEESEDFGRYQRQRACSWNDNSDRCRQTYRSTKSGPVRHSTQHRPTYIQSTKHYGHGKVFQGHRMMDDADSNADTTTEAIRNKRDLSKVDNSAEDREINKPIINDTVDINDFVVVKDVKWDDVKETPCPDDDEDVSDDVKTTETVPLTASTKATVVDLEHTTEQIKSGADASSEDREPKTVVLDSDVTTKDVVDATTASLKTVVSQTPKEQSGIQSNVNSEDLADIAILNSKITTQYVEDATAASLNTVVSEDPKEQSRTKRDVTSEDKKPEVVVLNSTTTDEQVGTTGKVEVKDTSNSTQEVNATTKEGFMKVKFEAQRFFQGRRFRDKIPKGKDLNAQWDASAVSLEKPRQRKRQHRQKYREEEEIRQMEEENAKNKEERLEEVKDKQRRPRKRKLRNMTPKTVPLTKLNAEFYNERKWPEGDVKYVIAENPLYDLNDVRRRLNAVNGVLKRRTCVQLRELTEDEANNYEDYLVIDTSPDYVTGRVGGRQNFGCVELFRGGQHRQHAAMMVMAMLGFYFEVARHDRDKYIRVHMRHVRPDKLHHFEKIREEATLNIPYDYLSATHPAWQFWRKIGKTGISTVATYKEHDPDGSVMKRLGQSEDLLSELDIVKINSVYGTKCFDSMRTKRKKVDKPAE